MAKETWTGASMAQTVLLTQIPSNDTELYATKAEVEAARGGETDLDTRLDGYDVNVSEVVAGRNGESSLLAKMQALNTAILAVTAANGSLVSANDTTPGFLNGKLVVSGTLTVPKTAAYSVTSSDLTPILLTENNDAGDETLSILTDITFTNTGAAGEVEFTLPAGVEGYKKSFRVTEAQYLKVTADGSETFRYKDTQSAGGGYIRSNEVGTCFSIEFLNGEWFVTNLVGIINYDK